MLFLFVIIAGYFLVEKEFNWKRTLQLLVQVLTYSAVIYIVWIVLGLSQFSVKLFIKAFLPTTFRQYWFFTCYIVLLALSPFINVCIKSLTRSTSLKLLTVVLALWSIMPTFTTASFYGAEFPQFVMFYLIGAYIRLYPDCWVNKKKIGALVAIVSFALMVLSTVTLNLLGTRFEIFAGHGSYFYGRKSVLVIACAAGLLIWAINSKLCYSKFINEIAGCTFGVYLIHDNNYVRPWLWQTVLRNVEWAESPWPIVHMVCSVVIVFVVCTGIEFVRRKTIEREGTRGRWC